MLPKDLEMRLSHYRDPYLNTDLGTAKAIKRIDVKDNVVTIDIVLAYPVEGIRAEMQNALQALLAPIAEDLTLNINISSQIETHIGNQGYALPNIKNIIAIASGKGGVGKSTIAINLALALAKEGASVGILDADIYGPSQPAMLGTSGKRPPLQDGKLLPIEQHGLQSMSIGYLVDEHAPMVWRGPMIGKAMQQMLHDTKWHALDYLIVDLPPGTGDIQLTLCQKIPVSGAVIVTTPQDLALIDVRRACEMFHKLNVPILGIVENMSVYHCSECGHAEKIFGEGGAAKLAKEYSNAVVGEIPLNISIREMTDNGNPPVVQEPDGEYAKLFCEIARRIASKLSLQTKDYSAKFPKIVVKHDK